MPYLYCINSSGQVYSVISFITEILLIFPDNNTAAVNANIIIAMIIPAVHKTGMLNETFRIPRPKKHASQTLLIKSCPRRDLAGVFFKVLSRDLSTDKNITKLTASTCTIECDTEIPTSVDGEKGESLPAEVKFLKNALKVFVDRTSDI
jgi:diacylglycerol kinase family enzyme